MTAPVSEEALLQSTAVIEAQGQQVAQQSLGAEAAVGALVLATMAGDGEAWYDVAAITEMATKLARLTDNLAMGIARSADVFTSSSVSLVTGRRFRPLGVRNSLGWTGERGIREGDVTSAGVFGRAADTYRYQQSLRDQQFLTDVAEELSSPTELATPLDAALVRAQKAAQTNLMLAARRQSSAVLAEAARQNLITGFRRVLHNELSEEGSCGLCIASSTRIYRAGDLLPMHPGCHCEPVPVTSTRDPGAAINDRDLERFYGDAGGTDVAKLRTTRYKVDEHGEYGPVLRPHGDPIRTADEALRDTNRAPRRPKTDADRARTLRARRTKLARAHRQLTSAGVVPPEWQDRLAEVERRIDTLDRQITRLGG